MKILIVDDESFFRISFMSVIDWQERGYEIIGDASDGMEALKLIEEFLPDIVFLDISMPVMNGIEVLKKLNTLTLRPVVIMLSSYTDFEYVREAMKLGAFDYIHKPSLNEEVVLDLLKKASVKLSSDRERVAEYEHLKKKAEKSDVISKQEYLSGLISGSDVTEREYKYKSEELNIKFKGTNLYLFAVVIDDIEKVKKRYSKEKSHIITNAFENITKEVLEEKEMEYLQYRENLFIIFKSFSEVRSLYDIKTYVHVNVASRLQESLRQLLNISVTIGISNIKNRITDIHTAFNEALDASELRFFLGRGQIIEYIVTKDNRDVPDENLNEIKERLNRDEWEMAKDEVSKLYNNIIGREIFDYKYAMKNYKSIFYMLRQKYLELKKVNSFSGYEFIQIEEIIYTDYLEDIHRKTCGIIDELCMLANASKFKDVKNTKINSLLKYIEANYREDLSLDYLADKLELNSSYLSRLFKKETGLTLIQYINELRIEKAIHYLRTSDMKNYEIAESVGFQSVEYFNTIFKKVTNKSPSEMKE